MSQSINMRLYSTSYLRDWLKTTNCRSTCAQIARELLERSGKYVNP